MAKKKVEEKINLDSILFKCRDILRQARNSGSFFEKRDMMLTLVFLRFIGEKFEDGIQKLRQDLIAQGLDPDDEEIFAAFFDDATFTDGTYNLPVEARWSTIINTPAPQLNVALDTALHSLATSDKQLKGCFVEGTFTTRNLAANDIKKIVDEVNKISHKAFGEEKDLIGHVYEYFLKEFAVNLRHPASGKNLRNHHPPGRPLIAVNRSRAVSVDTVEITSLGQIFHCPVHRHSAEQQQCRRQSPQQNQTPRQTELTIESRHFIPPVFIL